MEQMGSNYWQGSVDDGAMPYPRATSGVQITNELRRMMPFGYQSVGYYGPSGSCAEIPHARVRLGIPTAFATPIDYIGEPVVLAPRRPNLTCFGAMVNDAVPVAGGVQVTLGR
ncbi:hypothetical protein P9209_00435 [Prescottella defluvii]|nr:hypothetical protein P9209_00435 [Prescottella defluvii]